MSDNEVLDLDKFFGDNKKELKYKQCKPPENKYNALSLLLLCLLKQTKKL
jgi:hypothetical protein